MVTAAPVAQQQLIDRKLYFVKDNAEAQIESGLDVLRHVPSVTVTAKEQVQLLGDPGVKVMIDGHPITGGANALKSLPAARVAEIEILTNPSASYSAEGTGGVINIVTRHDAGAGLAGAATAAGGSHGSTDAKLAPSYSTTRWNAAVTLDLRHDLNDFGGSRERTADDAGLDLDQAKDDSYNISYFSSRLDLAYSPQRSKKWALSVQHEDSRARFDYGLTSLSRGSDQIPNSEDNQNPQRNHHDVATLGYNWSGKRQGENLNVSGSYDNPRYDWPSIIVDRFDSGPQRSDIIHSGVTRSGELKIDYVHPIRPSDILSIGGTLTHAWESETTGLLVDGTSPTVSPTAATEISSNRTTIAAYGTYQFPIGGWKILPGLRAEERLQTVSSPGLASSRDSLLWFPSLHVERRLSKRTEFALSFSRRVEWPTVTQLDPSIRYSDILTGESGNPDLKPQLTNAFETSFAFTTGKQSLTLKLFDRDTTNALATAAVLRADGVSISTTTNGGSIRRLGGELALSGQILKGLRYSASTTLLDRHSEILVAGILQPFKSLTYSGNLQLEYQNKPEGNPGANHFAIEAQFGGPTRQYQMRSNGFVDSTLRWTHGYTKRLSSIVTVSDLLLGDRDKTTLYGGDYLQIDRSREHKQRVMLSLVSRLGNAR